MKKVMLFLTALLMTVALGGCSFEEIVEHIDLDAIADFVLEVSKTKLEEVKTAEEIKNELPQELAVVTVDDTILDSQVTHLAIRDRKTDNTRQTDWVECEVIVEGEGIYARYICDLNYTYTRNGGWGLAEWSLDTESMNLQVTEGTMTRQLAESCIQELSEEFGSNTVSYVSSEWESSTLRCKEQFQVNATDGILVTQGTVVMTATLTLDTNKGLYYTWKEKRDDSGLVKGADLEGTTWMVSGMADTSEVALAFRVEEFSMEDKTLVFSAYSSIRAAGDSAEVREVDSQTVTWSNGNDGVVTFSIRVGDRTWDCCFDSGEYWARLDGSYIDALIQCGEDDDLEELVEEGSNDQVNSLEYQTKNTGNSWSASDGTVVYDIQVEYPQFTGENADRINRAIRELVNSVLNAPTIGTSQTELDELQAESQEQNLSLPFYNRLDITVQYNRNGYLSMLLTYTQRVNSGQVTYSYDSVTYDLSDMTQLERSDVLSAGKNALGALINTYMDGTALYSDSTAASYIQAWTLDRQGIDLYVTRDEKTGVCTTVTIPYSEAACILNPEE